MPKYRQRTNNVKTLLSNLGGGILALNGALLLEALEDIDTLAKTTRFSVKKHRYARAAIAWLTAPDAQLTPSNIPAKLVIHGLEAMLKVQIEWFSLLTPAGKVIAKQLMHSYNAEQEEYSNNGKAHNNPRRGGNPALHATQCSQASLATSTCIASTASGNLPINRNGDE